jgi:hypothetical protein
MYKCKKTTPTKPDRPVRPNPPKSQTAETLADRPPKLQEDPSGSAGSQRLARQDDAPGSMDEVIQFVVDMSRTESGSTVLTIE